MFPYTYTRDDTHTSASYLFFFRTQNPVQELQKKKKKEKTQERKDFLFIRKKKKKQLPMTTIMRKLRDR